jgi:CRISPR-associated protein Cas2
MYVILVYDMKQQRVGRMLKLCRRYLHWIQNSVFEGEISEVKLAELLAKARTILNEDEDSIILFKSRAQQWLGKQILGRERSSLDNIL